MLLPALIALAKPSTAVPDTVFRCSFGAKEVVVTAIGPKLRYAYGPAGRPEITLVGDPAARTVRYHTELFPHAAHSQLRFVRGGFSYILFNRYATPDYRGAGAEDRSGLLVLRGTTPVATRWCRSGRGFSDRYVFTALADDGEDVVPE